MGIFDTVRDKMLRAQSGTAISKPQSASEQPQEDIELAAFVRGKVEEVRSQANRVSHEGIWMTNIAYLLGFDSVYYDSSQKQFRPVTNSASSSSTIKRNRIHSNLILPDVQNRTARMCKNPPRYDVRPNSMEEDDKEAARLGVEVIGMTWDKQTINRKRIDLMMWMQQCGHSYGKISYDDQLGDPLPDLTGVGESTDGESECKFEGDIRFDVVSAFEGFADPLAKTFDEIGWFAQSKVRKLDYFRSHYENGDLVKQEEAWLLSAQYEMRINSLNSSGAANSGTAEQMKNAAIEISYYEKRSKKHPGGRHVVIANGIVLKNSKLPYGEIPFAKFDDVIVGGKYYSESLITHARPLQDQYNRLLQKRAQWENKLLAGKYIAAKGHGLIQEAMNDQSGEVVEYDPVPGAQEPHAMTIPVMPQYVYTSMADLEKKLHDIFGLSEVSRGQLPSASIPAIGIQMLLEQDETRIGIEIESHEHSWSRIGQLILKCADECMVTDRKLKTKGKSLDYMIRDVNGKMLKRNFDAVVIRGSTVPNSKVIKRQEVMNLFGQGLLGNPADPAVMQQVLSQIEYGDVGSAWRKYHLDMTQIQDSLKEIEEGLIPEVNPLDNHVLHISKKNEYRIEKGQLLTTESMRILESDINAHAEAQAVLLDPSLESPPSPQPPMPMDVRVAHAGVMGAMDGAPPPEVSDQPARRSVQRR